MANIKVLMKRYRVGSFGTIIPGLHINNRPAPYPVLNERAVRAGAGITFAAGFFAFFQAFYLDNFIFLQYLVAVLTIDFSIKVFIGPHLSPLSRLAQWTVTGQTPEYVGALQKRFAWSIGLILALTMSILIFGFSLFGTFTLVICGICLTFMFIESTFGICVGCKIYNGLISYGFVKSPEYKPACSGNVCET